MTMTTTVGRFAGTTDLLAGLNAALTDWEYTRLGDWATWRWGLWAVSLCRAGDDAGLVRVTVHQDGRDVKVGAWRHPDPAEVWLLLWETSAPEVRRVS